MKKIVLTGGGTAGHITPNIALIPYLIKEGFEPHYIGAKDSIEQRLISAMDIPFYTISTGKLRRYVNVKNFTDMFRVAAGVSDSTAVIKRVKPDIIFSKGGFVSVPVVLAAKLCGVPVIIHESDITPGLANKIAMPFATKILVNFPETIEHVSKKKADVAGTPVRDTLINGSVIMGREITGFNKDGLRDKPVLLVMGGSLGSVAINTALRKSLDRLLPTFNIAHICGKANIEPELDTQRGYVQYDYLDNELPHIMAIADIVLSRAGANSISEFLALKKPSLLIPLSLRASRGDQIQNAASFEKQGYSLVLQEDELTVESLVQSINKLYDERKQFIANINSSDTINGIQNVMSAIMEACNLTFVS